MSSSKGGSNAGASSDSKAKWRNIVAAAEAGDSSHTLSSPLLGPSAATAPSAHATWSTSEQATQPSDGADPFRHTSNGSDPLLPSRESSDASESTSRRASMAEEFLNKLRPSTRSHKAMPPDVWRALREQSMSGQVTESRVRKFLIRLATALHAYGSSAARTEFLVERAAERLEVDLQIAVFPTLLMLSFGDGQEDSPRRDTVLLTVTQDLDVDKLGRVDSLARNVGQDKHEILVAYWHLRAIANAPPTFKMVHRLIAYLLMAASAAPLFFGGSLREAFLAGLLGLAGGVIELWANSYSPVASSIVEFLAACFAGFIAQLAISLTPKNTFCYYPTTVSALVWFLPGLSLTLGVNELTAKTFVAGSSHVVASIFSAFQLGFGIAVGSSLVFWTGTTLGSDCQAAVSPVWAKAIWFSLYVIASNVLLNARADQWPGMSLVSLAGYVVSEVTLPLGGDSSSMLAALAVSISGTLYSRIWAELPLAMKTAGILVLVPGGIGVSGVAALLQKESASTAFVFEMLMAALAITLGLLVGKVFVPEALFGYTRRAQKGKKDVAADLRRDSRGFMDGLPSVEEEEAMAF